MWRSLVDPHGYFFWLLVVSAACTLAERLRPWRRHQPQLRPELSQDVFFLVFNGHFAGVLIAAAAAALLDRAAPLTAGLEQLNLLRGAALWQQVLLFLVAKDFVEWCIHNLLHRVPWLWTFHRLHHSIEVMDWIGSFRFHWMEIVVYRSLGYLPLAVLGVDGRVLLWVAILSTLIGHLNHSNLDLSWGPLRYLVNSPRMHIWHHMYALPDGRPAGVNFGIVFSVWDWLFGTSYWPSAEQAPEQQPDRLGFPGMETFPRTLHRRLVYPVRLGSALRIG